MAKKSFSNKALALCLVVGLLVGFFIGQGVGSVTDLEGSIAKATKTKSTAVELSGSGEGSSWCAPGDTSGFCNPYFYKKGSFREFVVFMTEMLEYASGTPDEAGEPSSNKDLICDALQNDGGRAEFMKIILVTAEESFPTEGAVLRAAYDRMSEFCN